MHNKVVRLCELGMIVLLGKLRFLFLFCIILLFCLCKAIEAQVGSMVIMDLFLIVLIIASLLVISEKKQRLVMGLILLGLLQIALILVDLWIKTFSFYTLKLSITMSFFALMTVACLRLTLQDKAINITTLFGSLSSYLFIGLSFAYFYLTIYSLSPHAFSGFAPFPETRAIYYSFVTLTTVGFGDIVSQSPVVQCLTWMEAFCGQAYLAIFISQLVGRYAAARHLQGED